MCTGLSLLNMCTIYMYISLYNIFKMNFEVQATLFVTFVTDQRIL